MRITLLCTAMLWSAVAVAQVTTANVVVEFTGFSDCRQRFPDEILIVVNGRENEAKSALRSATDPCRWEGSAESSFDVDRASISVRLLGGRTECQGAEPREDGDKDFAFVTFRHFPPPAKTLALDAGVQTPVSYVRRVSGQRQCLESGLYAGLPIAGVDFTLEWIVLQAAWPKPDRRRAGLIFAPPRDGQPSVTWRLFEKMAKRSGNSWTLTAEQYAAVYAHQQSVLPPQEQPQPPGLPGANAAAELARLREKKMKAIRLTIE